MFMNIDGMHVTNCSPSVLQLLPLCVTYCSHSLLNWYSMCAAHMGQCWQIGCKVCSQPARKQLLIAPSHPNPDSARAMTVWCHHDITVMSWVFVTHTTCSEAYYCSNTVHHDVLAIVIHTFGLRRLTHTHCQCLTHTLIHCQCLTHTLIHCQCLTHAHTLSVSDTHTYTVSVWRTHTYIVSVWYTHIHCQCLTHSYTVSVWHTHTLSVSDTHTHTLSVSETHTYTVGVWYTLCR